MLTGPSICAARSCGTSGDVLRRPRTAQEAGMSNERDDQRGRSDFYSLVHEAAGWLAVALGVIAAAYAALDQFVVGSSHLHLYFAMRMSVSVLFFAQFWFIRKTPAGPYSFLHGYLSSALFVGLFFTAVIRAGVYPAPYYGAPLLMMGCLQILPWRALHSCIVFTTITVLWLALNFHQGIEPTFFVHLKYLVGLSCAGTYASFLRHRTTVALSERTGELAAAMQKLRQVAGQTAHDIRSPIAALRVVGGSCTEMPELQRLLLRDAVQRITDIANNLVTAHTRPENTGSQIDDVLVSPVLHSVLSEKRACAKNVAFQFNIVETTASAASFARVDSTP
jgi:hypothetical protein